MDIQRARRNLRLLDEAQVNLRSDDNVNGESGRKDDSSEADTQIPDSLGLSSGPSVPDSQDGQQVFISTQVQSRLDDIEHDSMLKSRLKHFQYPASESAEARQNSQTSGSARTISITGVSHGDLTAKSSRDPAKAGKTRAKTTVRSQVKAKRAGTGRATEMTKSELLLKRLSGKHNKIKDILKSQEPKVAKSRQKKKVPIKYDLYNAQEWSHIYHRLMEKFPQPERTEIGEVYRYLYGDASEEDLWTSSQLPPESYKHECVCTPTASLPKENQPFSLLSLSQVIGDDFLEKDMRVEGRASDIPVSENMKKTVSKSQKEEHLRQDQELRPDTQPVEEDASSVVSDSTVDSFTVIPMRRDAILEHNLDSIITPALSLPSGEDIIDLTRSFKAVKCLISPLKKEDIHTVQVPATRTSTIGAPAKKSSKSEGRIRLRVLKKQLDAIKSSCFKIVAICSQEPDSFVPPTDTEDEDHENYCTVTLERYAASDPVSNTADAYFDSQLASQSVTKLRRSLKELGLKPSRSKSEMIASLKAASQVLESQRDLKEQREEIHNLLTSLVQSLPSLHEKVYTFQPVGLEDLLRQLTAANPFVDYVNEAMVREWADCQGICLKNS